MFSSSNVKCFLPLFLPKSRTMQHSPDQRDHHNDPNDGLRYNDSVIPKLRCQKQYDCYLPKELQHTGKNRGLGISIALHTVPEKTDHSRHKIKGRVKTQITTCCINDHFIGRCSDPMDQAWSTPLHK